MITKVEPYFTASPSNVSICGESCPFNESCVVWYTGYNAPENTSIQMFADVLLVFIFELLEQGNCGHLRLSNYFTLVHLMCPYLGKVSFLMRTLAS